MMEPLYVPYEKYNILLYYVYYLYYYIIYYIIFIIYYSSDSPSSLINESVCLVGKGRLKEKCGLDPRTNFFRLRNQQNLVWIRFECGLYSRIYGNFFMSICSSAWYKSVPTGRIYMKFHI